MKISAALLTAFQVSTYIFAAQSFVIISTRVQNVLPTPAAILPRQGLLDTINSAVSAALGDDDTSTASPAAITIPPPAVAAATTSSKESKHTDKGHSSSDDSQGSASTSSDEGSAATSSTTISTSTSETTTSTSTLLSTTATPGPSSGLAVPSTATPSAAANDSNNNGVPAGGVAVAVIMILLVLAVTAFLVFRYNPRCQAWWAAREEKLRQERSYREAIDGPDASSTNLRQYALSGNMSRRRTMLQSFFAPATAKLSENTEIRRKPVNWGAPASPAVPKIPRSFSQAPTELEADDEKLSLTASAAPLGQIERYSIIPVATQLPAPPLPPKPLPATKPLPEIRPTYLPVPTSGSFVAELPASVPIISPRLPQHEPEPQPISQSTTIMRNLSNPHGFGGPLPATRYQPQPPAPAQPKTPTAPTHPMTLPVSPISLQAQTPSPSFGSVSPLSTFTRHPSTSDHMRSISSITTSTVSTAYTQAYVGVATEVPMLPPLPTIPSLVHAKKGEDGILRLI